MSDSLLENVEECLPVQDGMADICRISLTKVSGIDHRLSGAAVDHFIASDSVGETTDENLDSFQIESSVASSTRK